MTFVIAPGTVVPVGAQEVFSTAEDNQPSVQLSLLAGTSEVAAENRRVFDVLLSGIPPAPRGSPELELSVFVDDRGEVCGKMTDLGTGKFTSFSTDPSLRTG